MLCNKCMHVRTHTHTHTHTNTHTHSLMHSHTHTYAHTVPSAPLNVAAGNSSSTSIIVYWFTPALPRGIITSYSIIYYVTMSGEASASTVVVGGTTSSVEIEDLMKYTEYTVFVHANTSVGRGERSESVTVTTDEDSELNIVNVWSISRCIGMGYSGA